jgi:protocatechuate 3,4-dioxygenase alpha subunit
MPQRLDGQKETASQTGGPYVHIGLTPNFCGITGVWAEDLGTRLVGPRARGARSTVTGRVFDGLDAPVRDCVIVIWQADAAGLHAGGDPRGGGDPDFAGWGRCPADPETGLFRFETIKPGRVPFPDGRLQAPHISFWIVARGINIGLNTRLYFGDERAANAEDPILMRIEHRARAETLIARREGDTFRFDIHLQGPHETVFFDI